MRHLIAAIVGILCLIGCQEDTTLAFERELTHDNGLKIQLLSGFSEIESSSGFILNEEGDLRAPQQISITFADAPPVMASPQTRTAGDHTMTYEIVEAGSGSGGVEYVLTGVTRIGGKTVALRAISQSEQGVPGFEAAWAVMESARVD